MSIKIITINDEDYNIYGKSAYESAVENGFEGTEQEWIASLKGEKGDAGDITNLAQEFGDGDDLAISQQAVTGAFASAFDVSSNVAELTQDKNISVIDQEFIGSIVHNGEGFTYSGTANNYIAYKFTTEKGKTYTVSFRVTTGSISSACILDENKWYSDVYKVATLYNYGNGLYSCEFTATGGEQVLCFYVRHTVPNVVVEQVCVVDKNLFNSLKIEMLPDHTHELTAEMLPDHTHMLDDFKERIERVCPLIYAVRDVGGFELYHYGMFDTKLHSSEYSWESWGGLLSYGGHGKKVKFASNPPVEGNGKFDARLNIRSAKDVDLVGFASNNGFKFKIKDKPSNPSTQKKVFFVGDSLIADGALTRHFKQILADNGITNINLIGRVNGGEGNRYEATGGFAWNNYVDDPATLPVGRWGYNYFWNDEKGEEGGIDLPKYFSTYCEGEKPDYIICNIGWNHLVNSEFRTNDMNVIADKCKVFLKHVKTCYPDCKVILNGIHHSHEDIPIVAQTYKPFGIKLNKTYNEIASSEYSSFVTYCDVAPYFDYEEGLQKETMPKNRFTEETETYVSDYVHPSDTGYKMHALADALVFMHLL